MSININSKKKWHPSRYEVQVQIEQHKDQADGLVPISTDERIEILEKEDSENTEYISWENTNKI